MVKNQLEKMDALISQGDLVNAIELYFAEDAVTSDYGAVKTIGKSQMKEKIDGFLNAIAKVNEIKFHRSMTNHNSTASEFTFDFEMKDGSSIYWHEIIRRIWNDQGKVIEEVYFDANGQ